jgi:NAD(P)-dependent dehydrogenase (short-subunit alcohol dehydrogenase family)
VAAIRAAARVLPEGGRIINIGSGVAARTGAAGVADHAGTKAALAGFTRGAARDLAPRGITVNLLQAGLVATQLNIGEGSAAPRLIASVALGRMGRPEEIAAGVLFLASPQRVLRHRGDPGHRRRLRRVIPRIWRRLPTEHLLVRREGRSVRAALRGQYPVRITVHFWS